MTAQPKPSRWLPDKSGYVTPDGEVIRLWNGPTLYGHRNSAQRRAQCEIQEQQERHMSCMAVQIVEA